MAAEGAKSAKVNSLGAFRAFGGPEVVEPPMNADKHGWRGWFSAVKPNFSQDGESKPRGLNGGKPSDLRSSASICGFPLNCSGSAGFMQLKGPCHGRSSAQTIQGQRQNPQKANRYAVESIDSNDSRIAQVFICLSTYQSEEHPFAGLRLEGNIWNSGNQEPILDHRNWPTTLPPLPDFLSSRFLR